MKILLAVQGTGNGHISRAREIIPHLQNYGELDIAISGTQADVHLSQPIGFQLHGFSFTFGTSGGVDRWKTFQGMNLGKLLRDIKSFPLEKYDLIINDFEPVTAWACKLRGKECIALSHQSSFLSKATPRPNNRGNWAELILKYYAPSSHAIGFHFQPYADFIHTPVIRSEIRQLEPSNKGHYTVYLPAYHDHSIIPYLNQIGEVRWEVFSKHSLKPFSSGNVSVMPVQNEAFNTSLASAEGLLTGGGFEGPAEAMFLGKKVLAIPMTGQWEQQCNAEAMRRMGVSVSSRIEPGFELILAHWVREQKPLKVNFPDETAEIIRNLIATYGKR